MRTRMAEFKPQFWMPFAEKYHAGRAPEESQNRHFFQELSDK